MKLVLCFVLAIAFVLLGWFSFQSDQPVRQNEKVSSERTVSQPASNDSDSVKRFISEFERNKRIEQANKLKPRNATPSKLSEQELAQLQLKSTAKQAEIKKLLIEYDKNLSNKDEKKRLKTELAQLIEEYNQLTLPLALKAMEANGKQEGPQS